MIPAEAYGLDTNSWHSRLQELYAYWLKIHPPDRLPARRDFNPTAVPHLLPSLWMVDVQDKPFRLRYRLVGSNIVAQHGRDVTGLWLDEVFPDVAVNEAFIGGYRQLVADAVPQWRRGKPILRQEKVWELESLRLPLSTDGRRVDIILVGTVFYRLDGSWI